MKANQSTFVLGGPELRLLHVITGCTLEQILVGMALREDHTSGSLSYAQLSGH